MSDPYQQPAAVDTNEAPSTIRYRVIGISILMAFILYLDRICLGEIVKTDSFKNDVNLTKEQIGDVLGAFFFTYAMFQVPAGWLSDRFGARRMLTGYIVAWSLLTALTGFMTGLMGLLLARLACGVAQAGAYPTSSATIRRWISLEGRGRASGLISLGGRLGGTLAPFLTALLIIGLGGWREALWVYGAVGILIAAGYWIIVRNRPSEHPYCNSAEQKLIGQPEDDAPPKLGEILTMLGACCRSRGLWLNSLGQFFVNVGWAFLVTWLPTFLKEEKNVADTTGALMVSMVLGIGMVGQLIGGWATDTSVQRFGLRIGRVLPISVAQLTAGCAYLSCLWLDSVWGIIVCCAIVSLMTDVANPSIWSFMQDVGGRNTAAVFGWANMWGNFGASVSALMVPRLMAYGQQDGTGQQLVFMACGGAFFLAGFAAMGMDATRRLKTSRQE